MNLVMDWPSFLLGMAAMGSFVVVLILVSAFADLGRTQPKPRGKHHPKR